MEIKLPQAVETIISRLEELGYEAYAVGGCVRDTLMGREPEDWDITTSAKPMEIKKAFRRTIDTGIQHGTVTVMLDHVGYEVTTYRIDGEYEDRRHPKQVQFTANLVEDLRRRDFTINAMAYNPKTGLVDAFDGVGDLERGVICCVGDAGQRFDEDALRMLRAVRFSGQLGFSISEETKEAITVRARHLEKISAERIRVELTKLLVSQGAGQIKEAVSTGMTAYFLPELDEMMWVEQKNRHHVFTVGEHCIHSVRVMNLFFGEGRLTWRGGSIPEEVMETGKKIAEKCDKKAHQALCLTMLLHDVAKPACMTVDEAGVGHFRGHPRMGEEMAGKILRRLTFDNETIHLVKCLIFHHDEQVQPESRSLRRATARIGRERMLLLLLVQFADVLSQNPELAGDKLARILAVYHAFIRMEEERPALTVKELAVTGRDIMTELSVSPGPQIGEILQYLLEQVLDHPEKNCRDVLLALAKSEYSGKL
ncbi:MAG: CCA tRNA nucleotidyltransferase [Lachnospiraceae bacterium]|nr:CCA tRNA nucleotidyltransferase [Lachnospiraceae bacterium]